MKTLKSLQRSRNFLNRSICSTNTLSNLAYSSGLFIILLCCALSANTALAGVKPPPSEREAPSPSTPIGIEIIPDAPHLSASLTQSKIRLEWDQVENAQYYGVFVRAGKRWEHLENTEEVDFDMDELEVSRHLPLLQLP